MPRSKEVAKPPSDDIGWKFADPVDGSRTKSRCKLCDKIVNGGITRLKQHLAHVKGEVTGCNEVSDEVKAEMRRHLNEKKFLKEDKLRRASEVEEHIRSSQRSMLGEDDEYHVAISSDDSDRVMEDVLRESLLHNEFRNRAGDRYGHGASSRGGGGSGPTPSLERRSQSVRDGRGNRTIDPNSAECRLASMDPLMHRSKGAKQQKISTKVMKGLRKKLGTAVSQFVIFSKLPFSVVRSQWLRPMLDTAIEVGPNVAIPTPYEVSEVYLKQEFQEVTAWIESQKPSWKERGVTIMCDGWKSKVGSLNLVNFLAYSNRGTVYLKSIDVSNVISKTGDFYFKLMDKVVDEIGEEYVVQVVTDNESAVKAGGLKLMEKRKHLYWTPCAAHCIDLMLEEIAKKSNVKKLLAEAQSVTSFIYSSSGIVNFMKRYTSQRELLRPAPTRFATNFLCLESLFKYKDNLQDMFTSTAWKATKWSTTEGAKVAGNVVGEKRFWSKVSEIVKVEEPLLKVLRLVDGDEKPTMGFVYEAMDRARKAIENNSRYHADYCKIIDKRWDKQLHHRLHAAGYFLNPQFQYGGENVEFDDEVVDGVRDVIQRLEPDIDKQIRAINQIETFRNKSDSFGTPIAQRAVLQTNAAEWWLSYGRSAPELRSIAVKVLSQTTSSSGCERNWSTFSLIHTKTRNRLKYKKLNDLVFVYYNMRLKIRHATRRSQREIDNEFNPINLDYIHDEDDPLADWLINREDPLLDGRDNSEWLCLSDDEVAVAPSTSRPASTAERTSPGTPTESGGGLSPFSTIPSDSDSGPSGNHPPLYEDTHHGVHGSASPPRAYGHTDLHTYREEELIHDAQSRQRRTRLPRQSTQEGGPSSSRQGGFRVSVSSTDGVSDDERDLRQTFSGLDMGRYPPYHHLPHPYPYPAVVIYPQPYAYPVPPPHPYGYHDPHAYDQQPHHFSHNIASGIFGPSVPQGYHHQTGVVSNDSEATGSSMETPAHNYPHSHYFGDVNDEEETYVEPARNSFWI